jgi:hypothetical protein
LSFLGFWKLDVSFEYGLAIGSFKVPSYIRLMDGQAQKEQRRLEGSHQMTVVQNNGLLHTSQIVQEK